MRVERFKAPNMRDAMGIIRKKLGDEAVILHTRDTDDGVEIIAAVEQSLREQAEWFEGTLESIDVTVPEETVILEAKPETRIEQIDSVFADEPVISPQSIELDTNGNGNGNGHGNGHADIENWDQLIESVGPSETILKSVPQTMNEVSKRAVDFSQALRKEIAEIERQRAFWIKSEKRLEELKKELAVLKQHLLSQELAEVKERAKLLKKERLARRAKEQAMDQEHLLEDLAVQVIKRLKNRGISPEFATHIAGKYRDWILRSKINLNQQGELKKLKKGLIIELKKLIKVQPIAHVNSKSQRIAAVVGPTGSGKTETSLKMAMNYMLAFRKKVALVVASDGLAAEHQQTALLASLAKLPFSIVTNPMDLQETLKEHTDKDVIVIDFAMKYAANKKLLVDFVKASHANDIHLTMPADGTFNDLLRMAHDYGPVGFNYLLFTKVDKVKRSGHLLELTYKTGVPVSYLCTGETIPDDIEAANALTLAYMILKG